MAEKHDGRTKCKVCGGKHWLREPHQLSSSEGGKTIRKAVKTKEGYGETPVQLDELGGQTVVLEADSWVEEADQEEEKPRKRWSEQVG
jgi:hypothetical protein